ncbi:MAG TPA: low molecular weight phosphatase family protein [Acidimicrobiales bacterium]|jgi:protein-tyrosine-phosphatase|nr:low molecular weight phosphatase family protein [Acidimicrobiales bacterium]
MDRPEVVFLCTGNAARSVMATVMFRARCDTIEARGAGTHVIEGHPMSVRTRTALARLGLADPSHRSRQFWEPDAARADLIVAMAPEHVAWARRTMPIAAGRTATLKRLVRDLPSVPLDRSLAARIAALDLAAVAPEDWEEVVDPAAGEQDAFDACAAELDPLIDALIAALGYQSSSR